MVSSIKKEYENMKLNFDFGEKKEPEKPVEEKKPEIVDRTPFDHFDIEAAKVHFVDFEDQLSKMNKKASELKISDDKQLEIAMQMLIQCRTIVRRAEDAKDALPAFKVAKQFKNGVDKLIRERLKKPIGLLEDIIKPKVNSYEQAQAEIKRRIAQKKADEDAKLAKEEADRLKKEAEEKHAKEVEEAAALQEDLNKQADEAKVDRVTVPIPEKPEEEESIIEPPAPVVEKTDKVKTDTGSAKVESTWICEIVDLMKVPTVYRVVDQKLLDIAVKNGAREIPGCKIYESFETKVRLAHQTKQTSLLDDEKEMKF